MKKRLIFIAAVGALPLFSFAVVGPYPSPMIYVDNANGERQIMGRTPARNGQQIWDRAVYSTPSGGVQVNAVGQLSNPAGASIPTSARATIPPAAVAAAAGRVAAVAIKSLTPIGVGIAIYDLYKELNFTPRADGSLTKTDPAVCTTAPCYQYRLTTLEAWSPNYNAACSAYVARIGALGQAYGVYSSVEGDGGHCKYYGTAARNPDIVGNRTGYFAEQISPTSSAQIPASQQDFIDAVAAKSSWPTTSKIGEVMAQDPQPELHAPTSIIATGPASSPGPVTTTVDTTNNTTNVQNTTYNYTYSGDKVTTTTNVTNITTNNSTGAVVSSTTSNSTPAIAPSPAPATPVPPVETCGLPGKPACKIDETGTPGDAGTSYEPAKTAIDIAKSSIDTNIGNAAVIAAPAWSFAFQLPTGCAPYVTGIKGVVLNVCQYQSTIHGLLSAIWAAATAFAMIGMVGRTIREA